MPLSGRDPAVPYNAPEDPLNDFETRSIELDGVRKDVLVTGDRRPAVVIMRSCPGSVRRSPGLRVGSVTLASSRTCRHCSGVPEPSR